MNEEINLLFVEDDTESGEATKTMLEMRGVKVCMVPTAEEAVAKIDSAEQYDIVVADIHLKNMSGIDLLRVIRQTKEDLPVILFTGFDDVESSVQALKLGAQDYIIKPLTSIEDLLVPVRNAVDVHRMQIKNRVLQQYLTKSETLMRAILENSTDTIYRLDIKNHTIDYISPSVEQILGYKAGTIIGKNLCDLTYLIPEDFRKHVLTFIESPDSYREEIKKFHAFECQVRHCNGELRWIGVSQSILQDEAGHMTAIVGNMRDITRKKKNEEIGRELQEKLARVKQMESVSILAGGVAHDLNNIFMSLVNMPKVMIMEIESCEDQNIFRETKKELQAITNTAERAKRIAGELLDLSRWQTEDLQPTNINHVIKKYIDDASFRDFKSSHPNVTIIEDTALDPWLINGSELHLSRVLMNLTLNAFSAMPQGGTLTIRTRNEELDKDFIELEIIPKGQYVVLEVIDTGYGISAGFFNQLFKPFHTMKNGGHQKGGTGLGLAVVYSVVKGHSGYISVYSAKEKGTRFSLYLPALTEQAKKKHADKAMITPDIATGNMMVVDDTKAYSNLMQRYIHSLGYSVTTTNSGEDALEIYRKSLAELSPANPKSTPYKLILLDMILNEDRDGLDIYREIHALCPNQKCVIMSAYPENEKLKEIMKLEPVMFVPKPSTKEQLIMIIQNELSK